MNSFLCPCHSQKEYALCCKPYHEGALPENALILMRSRYSAYALQLIDYIIQTMDLSDLDFADLKEWRESLLDFSKKTQFVGLKILEFVDGTDQATVTFHAKLKRDRKDVSFTEKSSFIKVDNRWLYKTGVKQ